MTWFLWALVASICAAGLAECNRVFRQDPQMMNAWRSTIAVALLAIAIPHMDWPDGRWFYIVAGLDGIVTAIGMIFFFYLAAQKTGRVSSMILPLAAASAYLTWWMMMPELRPDLMENPFRVLLASISATLVLIAMQRVRDNDSSWESFLIILPVGISFGIIDALTQFVLGTYYNVYNVALAYAFLALCLCAICAWIAAIPKPIGAPLHRTIISKDLLWAGFWGGFFTVGMTLSSTFSLSIAPHPAMPGIIMAFTPLWLYGVNFLRKTPDDVSLPASILIVLGAVGLLLSSINYDF